MPIIYDGVNIDVGYRLDLLVEESVVVEIKAVSQVLPVHKAQLISYLRVSNLKLLRVADTRGHPRMAGKAVFGLKPVTPIQEPL